MKEDHRMKPIILLVAVHLNGSLSLVLLQRKADMPTGTVSKTYACQDRGNCGKSMKKSMPEFIPSWTIVSTAGTAGSFLPFVCWKQDEKNIVTDSSGVKSLVNDIPHF